MEDLKRRTFNGSKYLIEEDFSGGGASVIDMSAHTIHVSVGGNDSTADGTQAKPYATLQAAYDSIPLNWFGEVTLQLDSGSFYPANNGQIALDTADKPKNYKKLSIRGTSTQTADGTRIYGRLILSNHAEYNIKNVWVFPNPHNQANTDNLVTVQDGSKLDMAACALHGASSNSWTLDGALILCGANCECSVGYVTFSRAVNGVRCNYSMAHCYALTFNLVTYSVLAYQGSIIVYGTHGVADGSAKGIYEYYGKVFKI